MAAGEDEAVHDVVLHLYDLSQGMARTMSAALLGRQVEGIWHTGVVVHGASSASLLAALLPACRARA